MYPGMMGATGSGSGSAGSMVRAGDMMESSGGGIPAWVRPLVKSIMQFREANPDKSRQISRQGMRGLNKVLEWSDPTTWFSKKGKGLSEKLHNKIGVGPDSSREEIEFWSDTLPAGVAKGVGYGPWAPRGKQEPKRRGTTSDDISEALRGFSGQGGTTPGYVAADNAQGLMTEYGINELIRAIIDRGPVYGEETDDE